MQPQHFASPFFFRANGDVATNTQNTEADLAARVLNVCLCIEGEREDNPAFGIPDPTFANVPLDIESVQRAVEKWAETPISISETAEALNVAHRLIGIGV